jgi:hypothetical protein
MKRARTREVVSEDIADIPASARITVERARGFGSIPDLSADELADQEELERMVAWQMWKPLLTLRPAVGPSLSAFVGGRCCEPNWAAVRPVVYRRRARRAPQGLHEADQLRDELSETLKRLSLAMASVKSPAKYLVLKYLRMGIIELEQIADTNMQAAAKLYLDARRLRQRPESEAGVANRMHPG